MAKKKIEEVTTHSIINDFEKSDVEAINACIKDNSPALLVGQTGLGKTTLISELAKESKKNLIRLSVHSGITGDEILGKWLAKNGSTIWQDGLLIQAMKNGDWIVFDEINACPADVLFALHSLLDDDKKVTLIEKDGEVIKPHADFRFFATMNPIEDYAGTKELNMAFFSRFGAIIEIKPFSQDIEVAILERKGIEKKIALNLVNLASNLRIYKTGDDIIFFCGTRDLIHAGRLINSGLDKTLAINYAILNKMSPEDKSFVLKKDLSLKVEDKKDEEIRILKNDLTLAKVRDNKDKAIIQGLEIALKEEKTKQGNTQLDANTQKALKILGVIK